MQILRHPTLPFAGHPTTGPGALEALAREAPKGSIVSIGLWGPVSPPDLRRAILAARAGGAETVGVVPMSLMTEAHWRELRGVWG